MGYKAVVSDLDGTLLNGNHEFSSKTKEIIKKVKDSGRKIFIATGRHPVDALGLKKVLGLDSYVISSNGAMIHDEENRVVYEKTLDEEIEKIILSKKCSDNISRHIYTKEHWYTEKDWEEFKEYHQENKFCYIVKNFNEIIDEKVIKIAFVGDDQEELIKLEKDLEKELGDRVSITLSSPNCLEFMAPNISKGGAVKSVMEKLGIPLAEVVAFGDGLNDYEMLSTVGKGLIMGNASERLKEKYPTGEIIEKNTEDGVAKYLEKNILKAE